MFKAIKEFFFGKPTPAQPEAPYKVEAPVFKPTADAAPIETTPATVKKSSAPRARKTSAPRARKTSTTKKPAVKKPTPTP